MPDEPFLGVPDLEPVAPQAAPATHGRELLLGGAVVLGAATVTFALLMSRSTPASEAVPAPAAAAPAAAATNAPAAVGPATAPEWTDANAALWLGARRAGVAFEVAAEKPIAAWMKTVHPVFVVRCSAGTVQAFVVTDTAAKLEAQTDDHTVRFAFDGEAETDQRWQDSTEHDALFAPDGAAFATRVMSARTLRFTFTPHNAAAATTHFNVTGLAPLLQPAVKACGWK